jgi:hypothetical protein
MNQISSNVLGYVYSSIPQKRYASGLGVTEFGFGGGKWLLWRLRHRRITYFARCVSSSPVQTKSIHHQTYDQRLLAKWQHRQQVHHSPFLTWNNETLLRWIQHVTSKLRNKLIILHGMIFRDINILGAEVLFTTWNVRGLIPTNELKPYILRVINIC